MTEHERGTSTTASPQLVRKAIIGATVGSIVEWYDVAVYAYLAAVMGLVFFPSEDPTIRLLSSFAAFAVTFLIRPLGGAFFGSLADRIGRQRTLAYIIILVSIATFGIGLLPVYGQIGVAAPVLLVVLRLVQGFSAGGELTGAAVYVAEYAPPSRRGFNVSIVQMGGILGFLLGSVVVLGMNLALTGDQIESWGWRVPFILAAPLGLIGLYIRARLEETPEFKKLYRERKVAKSPLADLFRHHKRAIAAALGFSLFHNATLYVVITYVPSHQTDVLGFSSTTSSISSLVTMTAICLLIPFFGRLSDRIGRKAVLLSSCVLNLAFAFPLFMAMGFDSPLISIAAHLVLGSLLAIFLGASLVTMTELFEPESRATGIALGYNIAVSVFGGTAPFFMVLMISGLQMDAAPGLYICAAAIIGIIAVISVRDTAAADGTWSAHRKLKSLSL